MPAFDYLPYLAVFVGVILLLLCIWVGLGEMMLKRRAAKHRLYPLDQPGEQMHERDEWDVDWPWPLRSDYHYDTAPYQEVYDHESSR